MSPKKDDKQTALMDFLFEEVGGREEAMKRFYGRQVAEMASQDATHRNLVNEATEGGWLDELHDMKLTSLANIINPPSSIAPTRPGTAASGKRMTQEEKARLHDDILAFLEKNPWMSARAITKNVNSDARKLGPQLRTLKEEKKIKSQGERAATRYALASEKSNPS